MPRSPVYRDPPVAPVETGTTPSGQPVVTQTIGGPGAAPGASGGTARLPGADDDTLAGGGGDDTIGALGGDDILYGNQGSDMVTGRADNDTLYGAADGAVGPSFDGAVG